MDTKNSGVIFGDISKNITPKSHRYLYSTFSIIFSKSTLLNYQLLSMNEKEEKRLNY